MATETILNMEGARIKFGAGATRELGFELRALGVRRAFLVTDPVMAASEPVAVARASLRGAGIDAVLYADTRVEPSDASFLDAIGAAREAGCDGFAAVGGGSAMTPPRRPTCTPPTRPTCSPTSTTRSGAASRYPAAAANGGGAHHRRHRQRDHRRGDLRLPGDGRQDRHRTPRAASHARHCRPRQHAHLAAGGGGQHRPRRAVPRRRVVHGDALHRPRGARRPGAAARLPGCQSDQRPVGRARHRAGGGQPGARHARTRRPPRAHRHAARRHLRPATASATPACTCRTACPTRYRAW